MKRSDKIHSFILLLILILPVYYLVSFILFSDFTEIIYFIPDDSSYYLKIAEYFSDGFGFTFDGINRTNGFHPLWQYILIPVFYFSNTSPENTLRIVLIIQVILMSLSFIIFYRILTEFFDIKIILAFAACFFAFVFFNAVNGMETSLLIFVISVLFITSLKFRLFNEHNILKEFIWGMITGLLVLARLDMIFFAFSAVSFVIFLNKNSKENLLKIINILIGMSVILIPYLIYNFINYGNIIPISGDLKSGVSFTGLTQRFMEILKYRESYFAIISIAYFIRFLFSFNKIKKSKNYVFQIFLAVFALCNFFLFIYLIFFINWGLFYWYFITYSLFFSLFICLPLNYIINIKKYAAGNIILYLFFAFITIYWGNKIYTDFKTGKAAVRNNWNIESYKATQWTKSNTNSTDIFAMKDAGHFGFFSGRSTINLDGLVNSFEYQEILKNNKLNDYLKSNNVKYFVQHAIWDRDDITSGNYDTLNVKLMSHKYSTESDPVTLYQKNEVYRSEPYYDGDHRVAFIIWKLDN